MKRITAIDFTRGLVMIIMALDHVRDMMHLTSLTQSPTDLNTTSPLLFFTRWITHLCAPTFVFLSGASAFLSFKNTGNATGTRNFLLSRGVWLIVLEFTLVNFALWFDVHFRSMIFEVIAAIGFGFIVLALLLKLPARVIGFIGLFIIFAHNLFALLPLNHAPLLKNILTPLFGVTAYPAGQHFILVIAYPPIPWLGIMLAGFGAGPLLLLERNRRKRVFRNMGLTALLLFIIIRLFNFYGDPAPWAVQKNALFTFLSFINVTKYPPSLLFCLLMLGIMFVIFSTMDGIKNKVTEAVTVYGKVPLFYFLIHLYVIHLLMFLMVFLQGYGVRDMVFENFHFGRPMAGSGVGLALIYVTWIVVVLALYPMCKWYGRYKAAHKEVTWLRYL